MTDPQTFYGQLYEAKRNTEYHPSKKRDWLHRWLLDPLFDPRANPRHQVAAALIRGGSRLLDVGCWDGRLLETVRETGRYEQLYGIDTVPEGIQLARSKGFDTQLVDLNREPFPFPDRYFDGVTMLAVLEHVFDPFFVLHEARRVLRPGGEIVVDVPNVASFTNRLRILSGKLPVTSTDAGWDGGHLHYFTKKALDRFLQQEGFRIIARRTTGGRPRLRELWLSLLAGELVYHCERL